MTSATALIDDGDEKADYVKQHLIDPETCLRCGSCEVLCPHGAIQLADDGQNYAIDPAICTNEHQCLDMCGTDAIRSWRMVPANSAYSLEEQFSWESLPEELELDGQPVPLDLDQEEAARGTPAPASAATPVSFLYTQHEPLVAKLKSNVRVTADSVETDIRHIVLDFSGTDFPWLEGQNVGIIAEGVDAHGHPHHMRAYSIASDRDGEIAGTREMALTVKRVIDEWEGKPYHGVCSNYLSDLEPGATVRCIGPIGEQFLMPQDPASRIMMICTGTGIAPMRSFIQRQQRLSEAPANPMQLFYGGRTPAEMGYYQELLDMPSSLLTTYMAVSRSADHPRRYVQDLLLEHAEAVADFLRDANGHIFVCGLLGMEQGVVNAFASICDQHGLDWDALHGELLEQGRLQIETY